MNDIVIIKKNKEEMVEILEKIEKYFNCYGMKISDKFIYTSNKEIDEEIKVQNI
jgi:hypothetical protein